MTFSFRGRLPSSKSLFIRALIAGSYSSDLAIDGVSDSEDIDHVSAGLASLEAGEPVDCGDGGAPLRFLALRASRIPGNHLLTGSRRLFSRPHRELIDVLSQLEVDAALGDDRLEMTSRGWPQRPLEIAVDCSRSTQFASGVLLNAWGLEDPLTVAPRALERSRGYWSMTKAQMRSLGMRSKDDGDAVTVLPRQTVAATSYAVETDMGCAFAIAAVAAVSGEAVIEGFPSDSLQPDARFTAVLEDMGADVARDDGALRVGTAELSGITIDLGDSPDLFPVLGALAAVADGASVLGGASHLRFKESDRIAKVAELVEAMGREVEATDDGLRIGGPQRQAQPFSFDADQDHRLAMAAAVAHHSGTPISLTGGEAVAKSFGSFWEIVGWKP